MVLGDPRLFVLFQNSSQYFYFNLLYLTNLIYVNINNQF